MSRLTNNSCVNSTVDNDGLADSVKLLTVQEVAAAISELLLDLVINAVKNGNRLLGSADHTVIEGLGVNDGANCKLNVSGIVDDNRGVTRTNAQSWLTRRVSCVNHTWTTGCQNDVSVAHDCCSHINGRSWYPVDNTLGAAGLLGSITNNTSGSNGALFCAWVWGNDNGVSCLQSKKCLENCGRSWVSSWNNCSYDTHWLGYNSITCSWIILYNTTGLHVLILVVNVLCCVMVLDNLVFHYTHASFFNCHASKRDTIFLGRKSSFIENLIDLLLSKCCKLCLCLTHLFEALEQSINILNLSSLLCHKIPFYLGTLIQIIPRSAKQMLTVNQVSQNL